MNCIWLNAVVLAILWIVITGMSGCASPSGYQPPGAGLSAIVRHEESQRRKP